MKVAEKIRLKQKTIVEAAERLFLANGYSGTTMDAVALEAGVTKQTVYRYFPSKVSLFTALLGRFDEDETEFFFSSEGDLAEELRLYGGVFLTRHMRSRNLALFRLMLSESRHSSELGDLFRFHAQPYWLGKLTLFLSQYLPDQDAKAYAHMYNAMLLSERTPLLMRREEGMTAEQIRNHVDFSLQLFLHGLPLDR